MRWTCAVCVGLFLLAGVVARAEDADPLDRGQALIHTEKHAEGVELLRRVIREAEGGEADAQTWLRVGRAHFYLEEDVQAVAAVEKAISLEPEDAWLHYWLTVVWKYSDVDKALAACKEALRLDPKLGKAWYELGALREMRKERVEQLDAYLKAAELLPDSAGAHYKAGNALKRAKRYDEAIQRYRRAVELRPTFTNAWYNAALIHYLVGRFEEARTAWGKASELAPDDLQVHAKLVQTCHALGRREEAETWRQRVLAIYEAWDEEKRAEQKDFCFDQFAVDDMRVYACENFAKEGGLYYHYVFKVIEDGKRVKQVNLESSDIGRELGFPYVLGGNEGEVHRTYPYRWSELPDYDELKSLVIQAIRGTLPVGAESERGKIRIYPDR